MTLRLHNTLTRSIEPFQPLEPGRVRMYVCGPTVYDDPHIGHVRSAFVFDVLRRYLGRQQLDVAFVRNVTDVDDKIIDKARQECVHSPQSTVHDDLTAKCTEVATRYLASYHEALARLGIEPPTTEPCATAHVVPEMTDFIAKLLVNGIAYEATGDGETKNHDVYFAVRKHEGYGVLSNRTVDELQAGARVEPGEQKRDPMDFALWKAAKPGEPSWSSPWGQGRPGWHIECSAMSTKYLGDAFDIHGGGLDLIFPHHENELAQSNAAGKPFAKLWMHHGLLTVNGEKMSKSLGNFITVDAVLQQAGHPDVLKLFFLKAHYRSPVDFTPQRLAEARTNWDEFRRFFEHCDQQRLHQLTSGSAPNQLVPLVQRFHDAMDDDLNTPRALAVLFELVNLGHRVLESGGTEERFMAGGVRRALLELGTILGLFLQGTGEEPPESLEKIRQSIAEREAARKHKDFHRADAIRTELREQGVWVVDTANGPVWHRVR